ncbi:MAG: alpha/beta fold hydrolase [Dehalococcoidia bacterium]
MGPEHQSVTFLCEGQKLYADLTIPRPGAPCILMSHGFEASKNGTKWSFLAPRLMEEGYATFRFNYRGCGAGADKSEGRFEDTTLTARVRDYEAALDYLGKVDIDHNRIGVIGSSFGGEVPIAARDPRVKALVLLATPSQPGSPTDEQLQTFQQTGYFQLPSGKRLKMSYFEDSRRYNLCKAISSIERPVLIIHGRLDWDVPLDSACELYDHAREPKRLEVIEGGEHALRRPEDMARILELSLGWFSKHL